MAAKNADLFDKRMLLLVLNGCLKIDCKKTKTAVYSFLPSLIQSSEELFDFIYYHRKVFNKRPYGMGAGMRRFLQKWYLDQDPFDLALEVLRVTSKHRWTHTDLITLARVRSDDPARAAVLMALVKNLDKAKTEFGSCPEAQPVLEYMKVVYQVKRVTDQDEAVRLMEKHSFDMDILPSHLLNYNNVWKAGLPRLPLRRVLTHLKTMSKRGFLVDEKSPALKMLIQCLSNSIELSHSQLQPGAILMAHTEVLRRWTLPNQTANLPVSHPSLLRSLEAALGNSIKNVPRVEGKVLVILDSRKTILTNCCWGCPGLACSMAAAMTLKSLVSGGATLEVFTRGPNGLHTFNLAPEETVNGLASRLHVEGSQAVDPMQFVTWARQERKVADMVLVLTDSHTEVEDIQGVRDGLEKYRNEIEGCKELKFVYSALGCKRLPRPIADPDDFLMLDVCGWNSTYLRILQAFLKGSF